MRNELPATLILDNPVAPQSQNRCVIPATSNWRFACVREGSELPEEIQQVYF
jgi:hypothetical protein